MSLAAIAAAHVAAKMIRDNMNGSSNGCSGLDYHDKKQLAIQNALLQCQDLSNIPDVDGYIPIDTDAKRRMYKSCMNCKHSKYFPYLHVTDENEYNSKTICLKMLIEFTSLESDVDDEHFCSLYEYDEQKEKCCCCNCGE